MLGRTAVVLSLVAAPTFSLVGTPTSAQAVECFGQQAGLVGTAYRDILQGESVIKALGGPDALIGSYSGDRLCGDDGRDTIQAYPGADRLGGNEGCDGLAASDGADILYGGTGNDSASYCEFGFVYGEYGNDTLAGNEGEDILDGGVNYDSIDGGAGYDGCWGGEVNTNCEYIG